MAQDPLTERRKPPTAPAEVRLTNETIEYLETRIAAAVAKGISGAITEDAAVAFWSAGLGALQKHATQRAGRFVIGGLWGLISKLGLFFALGGMVYALGGWSALAAFFKAVFGR